MEGWNKLLFNKLWNFDPKFHNPRRRGVMLLDVQPPSPEDARFLCESSVHCTVEVVLRHIVNIHNMRLQLAAKVGAAPACGEVSAGRKRTCAEAFEHASLLLSAHSVSRKLVMTADLLQKALSLCTNNSDAVQGLQEGSAGLFFAGRWLEVDRPISAYVGTNEKTKISVSLRTTEVPPSARGVERAVTLEGVAFAMPDEAPSQESLFIAYPAHQIS